MALHPLQGAFDRIDRAEEHFAQLKVEQESFGKIYHDALIVERDANPPHQFITREATPLAPNSRSAILLGEIVYNLRAALDYLIFELALKDAGTIQDGTQFPICDTKERFGGVIVKSLVGLNSGHRAAIEALQPYAGCNWTAQLRDISNPDKHRRLVLGSYGFRNHFSNFPNTVFKGLYAPAIRSIRHAKIPGGEEMDVYLATEAPIMISAQMPGGNSKFVPVVMLIEQIKAGVRKTLGDFEPEF